MVELGNIALQDDLIGVIDRALGAGVDADTFTDMVAELVKARHVSNANDIVGVLAARETPPEDEGVVIYEPGELPEGLIDLPTASKKYGIPGATLRRWIQRGKLPKRGRVKAPSPGRGYIVTNEAEILFCRDNPRKRGRKKNGTS